VFGNPIGIDIEASLKGFPNYSTHQDQEGAAAEPGIQVSKVFGVPAVLILFGKVSSEIQDSCDRGGHSLDLSSSFGFS